MVKYVRMIGMILLIGAISLPSAILGEADSVSMVIRGSEPFNPKGKFGFQLIFTDLKLSSHTQELGISYYLTPTWEASVHLLADFKRQKNICRKNVFIYDEQNQIGSYIDKPYDTLAIENSFRLGLEVKRHTIVKKKVSCYYGLAGAVSLPWNWIKKNAYDDVEKIDKIYYKEYELGIPLGIHYWITRYISASCDQWLGINYTYKCYHPYYEHGDDSYKGFPEKDWKYGMLDFHFVLAIHY